MPKKSSSVEDEFRPEYDFRTLPIVARGPKRQRPGQAKIQLAPDVAKSFPDSDSVNEALRLLIRIAKDSTPGHPRASFAQACISADRGGFFCEMKDPPNLP